jgi:arabinofuranan 3-O-arabinosyltransferase
MRGLQVILRRVFSQRLVYRAMAWTLTIFVAQVTLFSAWHSFDNAFNQGHRRDGNGGHAAIDFGAQYLMGRLLVEGHGRDLYNRSQQRLTLQGIYPPGDNDPSSKNSDAENMMDWMMGTDAPGAPPVFGSILAPLATPEPLGAAVLAAAAEKDWTPSRLALAGERRVGGPLYPPINAFLDAPLAVMPARAAYRVQQINNILLAFAAGLGIWVLSRRRIWWSIASLVILIFPGFMGSINLGQNATLTLTIFVWGWVLIAKERPGWGGLVWALLAFKPVWAMVFFAVLVVTRRWRASLAMLGGGATLGLLTLPFVGVHSWFDWLQVGKEAAQLYNTDHNWIFLSRDVLSIPRRWLVVFPKQGNSFEPVRRAVPDGPSCWWYVLCGGGDIPGWLVPALAGWGLLLAFAEVTVRVAVLRKEQARAVTGPPAAFLMLGAWLCCYHFMYYDVLLAALPVLLLFADPAPYFRPIGFRNVPLGRLAAVGTGSRWCRVDDARTGRLGLPLLGLFAAALRLAALSLGAGLAVYFGRLPWWVPVPLWCLTLSVVLCFVGVAAVVIARLARPLLRPPEYRSVMVLNRVFPTLAVVLLLTQPLCPLLGLGTYWGPPWDTFVLMAIWLWAGWTWLRTGPPPAQPGGQQGSVKAADAALPLPV